MKRSKLAGSFLLLGSLLRIGSASASAPPNIVLVIGDDHGWPYSGFMGHDVVETPNLDALAESGTVFTNAQVPASLCRPTHRTLLSGLHPVQWAAKREALVARHPAPLGREVLHYRTLPRELARSGYRSWQGGKLWEGSYSEAGFDGGMTQLPPGIHSTDGDELGRIGWDPARCGSTRESDLPCPALAPLRRFLDEIADAPFFLWFAPKLPHTPFDPPMEFILPYLRPELSFGEILYYAQVSRLDALVGELLRELDTRGLREDTLVVYLSDNGWEAGQGLSQTLGHGKATVYELGTRTPIVFSWPGRVPDGLVRTEVISAEDVFPTILDYAGAEPLPDRRGRSLKNDLERDPDRARERAEFGSSRTGRGRYVSFHPVVDSISSGYYVRTPRWRYMSFLDGREELYQIVVDPFERTDLADSRPDLLPDFRAAILAWQLDITRPAPRLEIAGRLVTEGGNPIAGASVRLHSALAPLEVMTDAKGAFRFQNLPHGDYALAPGRRVLAFSDAVEVSLPVGPGGHYLPHVVGLPGDVPGRPSASAIVGRVVTRSGEPVPDALVSVRNVERQRPAVEVVVRSGSGGRYLAENLPAGTYAIRAETPTGDPTRRWTCRVAARERCLRDLVVGRKAPQPGGHSSDRRGVRRHTTRPGPPER